MFGEIAFLTDSGRAIQNSDHGILGEARGIINRQFRNFIFAECNRRYALFYSLAFDQIEYGAWVDVIVTVLTARQLKQYEQQIVNADPRESLDDFPKWNPLQGFI